LYAVKHHPHPPWGSWRLKHECDSLSAFGVLVSILCSYPNVLIVQSHNKVIPMNWEFSCRPMCLHFASKSILWFSVCSIWHHEKIYDLQNTLECTYIMYTIQYINKQNRSIWMASPQSRPSESKSYSTTQHDRTHDGKDSSQESVVTPFAGIMDITIIISSIRLSWEKDGNWSKHRVEKCCEDSERQIVVWLQSNEVSLSDSRMDIYRIPSHQNLLWVCAVDIFLIGCCVGHVDSVLWL